MSNVKLKISTQPKGGKWTQVTASTGQTYWYRFSGGNKGTNNGNQVFVADGTMDAFLVTFSKSVAGDYRFTGPYRAKDPNDQLDVWVHPSGTLATVADCCTMECKDMIYGFYVSPVGLPGTQFLCDPRISNEP